MGLPDEYKIVNISICIFIAALFFYSRIYSPNGKYNVQCIYEQKLHHPCASCGLTRGLFAAAHFNFDAARDYNPASIPFFFLFASQLLYRGIAIAIGLKASRLVAITDIVLSVAVLIWASWSFYA
ncbi:MAG: hypothetical protein JWO06_3729 [Bacteroidota bacterium]|nr:hypothetical protein [Bacteroidota bacterium]